MNAQPTRLRKLDYVQHMVDAIRLVQSYVEGMTREAFLADKKTQQAVVLKILIIGEAAAQVGNEYPGWADQQSQIPWRAPCAACEIAWRTATSRSIWSWSGTRCNCR